VNLYSFSRVVEKADVLEIARVRATSEKEAREILAVNAYLWDVDDYSGGSDGMARLEDVGPGFAVLRKI